MTEKCPLSAVWLTAGIFSLYCSGSALADQSDLLCPQYRLKEASACIQPPLSGGHPLLKEIDYIDERKEESSFVELHPISKEFFAR